MALLDFLFGGPSYSTLPNSPESPMQGASPNVLQRFGAGLDRISTIPGLPTPAMDEEERMRQRWMTLANIGSSLARGGTAAEGLQQARQQALQQQILGAQLNEQQRKLTEQKAVSDRMAALRQRLQGLPTEVTPGMALQGGGGPTQAAANLIGQPIPQDAQQQARANLLRNVAAELALEPGGAAQAKALTELAQNIGETEKPIVLSPGAIAVSRTGRTIASAPVEKKTMSFEQRILEDPSFASSPAAQAWINIQKSLKEAGSTRVNVSTGDTFGKKAAEATVPLAMGMVTDAQSASSQIENSNRVRALLDQGVISGFAAPGRLALGQAAQALGYKTDDPRIANTAVLIPQLAQRTLNNASKMKGVLSDSDILLLTKVSNADISVGEEALRKALDISDRVDRQIIKRGMNASQVILSMPGMQPFGSLYNIEEPKPYEKKVTVQGKSMTAKQGPDGLYYVTVGGKLYRVEE